MDFKPDTVIAMPVTDRLRDTHSRQNGWGLLRERLKNVTKPEALWLFVFSRCRQFIWTAPVLPPDKIDRDDVDIAAEDYVGETEDWFLTGTPCTTLVKLCICGYSHPLVTSGPLKGRVRVPVRPGETWRNYERQDVLAHRGADRHPDCTDNGLRE
ncbi:MAG TPA: hypothetical protein PLF11_02490 [Bacillota bacterium]|nr:hypothetical protein [Bacillota bacterium]